MSEVIKLEAKYEVDEQAAAWVWRLDAQSVTEADRREFECWLQQDARHRRVYEELIGLWQGLDALSEAKRPEKIATFRAPVERSAYRVPLAWTASLAAVLIAIVALMIGVPREGSSAQTFATAVGQQRTVTLADHSVVTLNTNTIVESQVAGNIREVYLRKGEAHFAVAQDRTRPFLVHAGDAVVRALGTQFDVRVRGQGEVEVVVNEGRVEVETAERTAGANAQLAAQKQTLKRTRVLAANERLRTGPVGVLVYVESVADVTNSMAWRHGAVVFNRKSLAEAVAELNRYSESRLVVDDPRIMNLPVDGRFKTDDVSGFLAAVEKSLPVVGRRGADGLVYIEPRS